MAGRLSELQMCSLVKAYKEYECLWKVTNENYKNREVRDKAYREICEKLNIPRVNVSDIPQKIKNLRTSYCTEQRKVEASIKAGGKVYKPKQAWFSIAHEILGNDSKSQLDCEQNDEIEIEPETNVTKTNEVETQKKIAKLDEIATKITPQTIPKKRNEPQTKYEEDEFDVYGKYIAISLRTMPKEMSIIARMELQKIMADIQLRALRPRKMVEIPVTCVPSTSKMAEDPLDDPLDNMEEDISLTLKVEEEED
ncbi:hypothetical protein PYW07_009774 [Mythimna separata]|uniref:MADF domain-containing protein n=1 Tax=Mythimna separata TaxID=271217 RepID=A0AAD7YD67_MYTSE|nr:hypothetical protein PYW07_009774 [Mythimna separata]